MWLWLPSDQALVRLLVNLTWLDELTGHLELQRFVYPAPSGPAFAFSWRSQDMVPTGTVSGAHSQLHRMASDKA